MNTHSVPAAQSTVAQGTGVQVAGLTATNVGIAVEVRAQSAEDLLLANTDTSAVGASVFGTAIVGRIIDAHAEPRKTACSEARFG